jgi:hypothetical protein
LTTTSNARLLLPLLGRATEKTRDLLQDALSEATAWVSLVEAGASDSNRCVVCERRDGPFEKHHVAGKLNSDVVVSACVRCHGKLTERQNGWDPRWALDGNPESLRRSFVVRGLSDLCEERARFGGLAYHELGKRLRAQYRELALKTVGVSS